MRGRARSDPRDIELTIDGDALRVPEGTTTRGLSAPGYCHPDLVYLENLTPVNVCRVCVVDVEGSRTLVPACSRRVESCMAVQSDSPRVRLSRRMVSNSWPPRSICRWPRRWDYLQRYQARPERYGPPEAPVNGELQRVGHHHQPWRTAANVAQPPKLDNDLYVRDYSRCSYATSVEACVWMLRTPLPSPSPGVASSADLNRVRGTAAGVSLCVNGNCIGVCQQGPHAAP
jgi:hypothetical protein